ncbi:hypothetical protein COB18_02455 [Candidatus Kaiserbacteria bacterium]|nr:MAG: hypothetical protein COB18_02455 [Candidatus Kaiserbacteria bacterium]
MLENIPSIDDGVEWPAKIGDHVRFRSDLPQILREVLKDDFDFDIAYTIVNISPPSQDNATILHVVPGELLNTEIEAARYDGDKISIFHFMPTKLH